MSNPLSDAMKYDLFRDTLKVWQDDKTEDKKMYTTYMGRQILALANPKLFFPEDCCLPGFHFTVTKYEDRKTPKFGVSENKQPYELEEMNRIIQELKFTKRGIKFFLYEVNNLTPILNKRINLQKDLKFKGTILELCERLPGFKFEPINDTNTNHPDSKEILTESQRCIIYNIIGQMWDVRRRNLMILAGIKSNVVILDIDTKENEYSYDIFAKLCLDNGIDHESFCTGISKSGGYHIYFNFVDMLVKDKDGHAMRGPVKFANLITKNGKTINTSWDLRSIGHGTHALGVFYHEDRKEWSGLYFINPPYIQRTVEDELGEEVITTTTLGYITSPDIILEDGRSVVHRDSATLISLFKNNVIHEDEDGKYYCPDISCEEVKQFFEVAEYNVGPREDSIKKNPLNSRGIIKDISAFELVRKIFDHYDDEYYRNQTRSSWVYNMAAIKNSLVKNDVLAEVALRYYWSKCQPYVKSHTHISETKHQTELEIEWSNIDCKADLYPTLQGVIRKLISICQNNNKRKILINLRSQVFKLIKKEPQDPFLFQQRINSLTFQTFFTISNLEIRGNQRDMTTDIVNEDGNLYLLDSTKEEKFSELFDMTGLGYTLQDIVSKIKRTLCYVNNNGKSFYIIKDFKDFVYTDSDGNVRQDKQLKITTSFDDDYHSTEKFESMRQLKEEVTSVEINGKKIKITLYDIIDKFRPYITFNNITRDFTYEYSFNGKALSERYLSLYRFQALHYTCDRKDEERIDFMSFFIRTIGYMSDLKDDEIAVEIDNFKSGRDYTNATVKFIIYWLSNMITDWRTKNGTSLYITSSPGSGKTKFFEWFEEHIIGDAYCCATNENEIVNNKFNSLLIGKLLVRVEEIKPDKVSESIDILKQEITNVKNRREKKGIDAFEEKTFNRMVLMSNDAHYMGDEDRRFLYLNARQTDSAEYKEKYQYYYERTENKDFARVLYNYLISLQSREREFRFIDELRKINEKPTQKNLLQRICSMSPLQRYLYDIISNREFEFTKIHDGIHRVEVKGFHEHYQKYNTNHKLNKANFQSQVAAAFGGEKYVIVKPYSTSKRDHFIFENMKRALEYFFKKRNMLDKFSALCADDEIEMEIAEEIPKDERVIKLTMDQLKSLVYENREESRLRLLQAFEDSYNFDLLSD
jgi:hypothetical protein